MNLLIINDEELTADTMKEDIPWHDYDIDQVFTAYDAEQAKEAICTEIVDKSFPEKRWYVDLCLIQ